MGLRPDVYTCKVHVEEHHSVHVLGILGSRRETTKITCQPFALAVFSLSKQSSFPGSAVCARGSFCIERAIVHPTPDADKPTTLFCFPACTSHHHSLRTAILHCIHYLHNLYTHCVLLAIFISAALSTLIKCLQTPRSNHEQLLGRRKEARRPS